MYSEWRTVGKRLERLAAFRLILFRLLHRTRRVYALAVHGYTVTTGNCALHSAASAAKGQMAPCRPHDFDAEHRKGPLQYSLVSHTGGALPAAQPSYTE